MVRPSNSKPSLRVKIFVGDLDRLYTLIINIGGHLNHSLAMIAYESGFISYYK